ncbi:hypothetical protein Peur_023915 [Populus x canadensis]
MWFRMVRTRQGARTDPFPVQGSDQSLHYESDPYWDPLTDTSSYVHATSVYFEKADFHRNYSKNFSYSPIFL